MAPIGTTTTPPDEVEEGEGIPPAMFITVMYGYEQSKLFNTDVPCKMLMDRVQKVALHPLCSLEKRVRLTAPCWCAELSLRLP
jgi:hypothetical protein